MCRLTRCNFNKFCSTSSPMPVMRWRRIRRGIEDLGYPPARSRELCLYRLRIRDAACRMAIPVRFSSHSSLQKARSEEHTSELQSHSDLVCRLLLEKKK